MPTMGMELTTSLFTWNMIREAQRSGQAVLFTTCLAEECEMIADRVGIMSGGRILKISRISELKEKYGKHMVLEVYPTTYSDRAEVLASISNKFPNYAALPGDVLNPERLRWKVGFGRLGSATLLLGIYCHPFELQVAYVSMIPSALCWNEFFSMSIALSCYR
ncbi:unnamed protein product [Strongylus vulgaris]|uniref:Uncharacterized protein n=1 Tax=Strongylus vulgaris TaxID=40348 RepID=A0A3P7IG93_STRVU|nr:unnamed protein product [Strongylus vulgaris]